MQIEPIHEFLARVEMFKNFTELELNMIVRVTNRRRFEPGEVICREGENGDSMYIVKEGVVRVQRKAGVRNISLARLTEGMVVGEMSLVDNEPRSADLVAEDEAVLYEIRRAALEGLKDAMDPAAYKLLREIARIACERLRDVNAQIKHYIKEPDKLFEPDVQAGTVKRSSGLKERVNRFFSLFGGKEGRE